MQLRLPSRGALRPACPNGMADSERLGRATQMRWQAILEELVRLHGLPGAGLGVAIGDATMEITCGVSAMGADTLVTTETLFHLGSVSKLFTATLFALLASQRRAPLETAIDRVLPELADARGIDASRITARHLLSHTAGFDDDYFQDTGPSDDCRALYATAARDLPQLSPPGAVFSYSSAGFVLLARITEVSTRRTWEAELSRSLLEPLGMTRTLAPFEGGPSPLRVARGHLSAPNDGRLLRVPMWTAPRAMTSAGGVMASLSDLLRFAHAHLGRSGGVLSPALLAEMRTPRVDITDWQADRSCGFAWLISEIAGVPVLSIGGRFVGQQALVKIVPSRDLALVLLCNLAGTALDRELTARVFKEFLGLAGPEEDASRVASASDHRRGAPASPERYEGTYAKRNARVEVHRQGRQLLLSVVPLARGVGTWPALANAPLRPIDAARFSVGENPGMVVAFHGARADGPAEYVNLLWRTARRITAAGLPSQPA